MDVLVVGATGQQGGAVTEHLLDGDHGDFAVHALTRRPQSAAARSYADRGATIIEGDLLERDTLDAAVEDIDAVYCVTTYFEDGTDVETRQGTNMAEAAADAGVEHFVYSSVGGAERDTGLPYVESKYAVEQRIDELGLPATIIRPTFFMQNFERRYGDDIRNGTLSMPLEEGVSFQLIDADNIGALAVEAFANPEKYHDEAIELASDERTLEEMASVFSEVTGVDVTAEHVPLDVAREQMPKMFADSWVWFNEGGYDADIEALRREHDIELTRFDDYLREHWGQ